MVAINNKKVGPRAQRIIEAGELEGVAWRKKVVRKEGERDTSKEGFGGGRGFGVMVGAGSCGEAEEKILRSLLLGVLFLLEGEAYYGTTVGSS